MNWLTFLNPMLLWGLGLASIPVIIHLLFRRQFRRIDWAPMRYLKLTIQRNRRRVQIEQLLLLLMRIAVICLLFFLVARPVAHFIGLARWLGGASRTSRILVLDDSESMGLVVGDRSIFDRARELATRIVRQVEPQDRFTLVLASQPRQPLLREVEVLNPEDVVELLRKQKPTGTFVSWAPTMQSIDELVASSTYPTREVHLATDLRRAGWEQDLHELADRWASEKVHLRIYDLGGAATHQVALEDLKPLDPCALVGVPARWEALVRNMSSENLDHVEATMLIDGKPTALTLPPLAAGQQVSVPLAATFQEPGLHNISLKLPADDLVADNQRCDVLDVRERLRVTLIDGQPSNEPLASATDFLGLALSLAGQNTAAFQIEVLTDADLQAVAADRPDLLVMADVAAVSSADAKRLRTLVEGGMAMVVFVGDQIDPDNYNQLLMHENDLLPAQLESVSDQPVEGLVLEKNSPSALDALRQINPAVLERIKTNKYYQVRVSDDPASGVRVLARWNDAESSPAVVEKLIGRGRVLLWTTSANKAWTDWPTQPSYVLAMRESGKAIVGREAARDVTAGEPIAHPLTVETKVESPTIETPNATQPIPLTLDKNNTLVYRDTREPGLYRMNWQSDPAGQATDLFAVNPDARESDLTPIAASEVQSLWGALAPEIVATDTSDSEWANRGEEIWRPLAMALLALMAVEACFATWVGRQR
jgi:hypothetical protein